MRSVMQRKARSNPVDIYVYTYLKYTYMCIHIFDIYVYMYILNSTNNFYDP